MTVRPMVVGWIILALVAACAGPAAAPSSAPPTAAPTPAPSALVHRLLGTFTLGHAEDQVFSETSCRGSGGYDDIGTGTQVVVKDDAGRTIANGSLVFDRIQSLTSSGEFVGVCIFRFDIALPDAPFYSIEVSHRGPQTYSRADLESRHWFVELTLNVD